MSPTRIAFVFMIVCNAVALGGCKSSKTTSCEEARDIHVEAFERIGKPIAGQMTASGIEATEPDAEAMRKYRDKLAMMKEKYVPACEAVGGDKVLACVKQRVGQTTEPVSAECKPVLEELGKRVDSLLASTRVEHGV
jgi:hypothetical protein